MDISLKNPASPVSPEAIVVLFLLFFYFSLRTVTFSCATHLHTCSLRLDLFMS